MVPTLQGFVGNCLYLGVTICYNLPVALGFDALTQTVSCGGPHVTPKFDVPMQTVPHETL